MVDFPHSACRRRLVTNTILITGGCGYIGSHVVRQLLDAGERVIIIDDLSTGCAAHMPADAELIRGDCGDQALLTEIIRKNHIKSVMHLAAKTKVAESVAKPAWYYAQNVSRMALLLEVCAQAAVEHFIFSSSGTVYGSSLTIGQPALETMLPTPVSPYGRNKHIGELMLADIAHSGVLRSVSLRYFNVAGSSFPDHLGWSEDQSTRLLIAAARACRKQSEALRIYGGDYATVDGTCVRDYVHVADIAHAHLRALDYLNNGGESRIFNCGCGTGYSVREVISAFERVSGRRLWVEEAARRPGDPPYLVADTQAIQRTLNWLPQFGGINAIAANVLEHLAP